MIRGSPAWKRPCNAPPCLQLESSELLTMINTHTCRHLQRHIYRRVCVSLWPAAALCTPKVTKQPNPCPSIMLLNKHIIVETVFINVCRHHLRNHWPIGGFKGNENYYCDHPSAYAFMRWIMPWIYKIEDLSQTMISLVYSTCESYRSIETRRLWIIILVRSWCWWDGKMWHKSSLSDSV